MRSPALFATQHTTISKQDIFASLRKIEACNSEYLFIHSALNFGIPLLPKQEILKHLSDILLKLGAKYLIVPTFTFSFCNKENFDRVHSKSSMGMLNEYLRKLDIAKRTRDPILSCAIIPCSSQSVPSDLLLLGKHSCGKDSIFDRLHYAERVKFLFFGNRVHDCFTHSHYVEEQLQVPYRYNKEFSGYIIDQDKQEWETFILPVRYANVKAFSDDTLSKALDAHRAIKRTTLGNGSLEIVEEKQAYTIIADNIRNNIDFMLAEPYPREHLDTTYIYEKKVAL
ncbi:hypothetical protein CQA66_02130 [Helicobacter aurati]|uniref:Aminoglycoside N(3)-acetyltransferase n=1 Tax=Helicobacter aurati TaxID=137778 RepID=A0A3D8J782_9HELI|nr:AAC(3) family N-acetyltransferase [Helicobacter aurati]RDU73055.1 hypothetical protein CQA66_02130 [Helicobacter aurati]